MCVILSLDEFYVSPVTSSIKGWVGGFAPLREGNFSSFRGGVRCAVSSMEDAANGYTLETDSHSTHGFGDFVSFADDLQTLQQSLETSACNHVGGDVSDLFVKGEPGIADDTSGVSPTTFADDDIDKYHALEPVQSEGFDVLPPGVTTTSFSFDAALNVAFNSADADQPKQIWETGIWKHIFGSDDSVLDFDVWGPPLTRPTPVLWGVDSHVLEDKTELSKKRVHAHSCTYMDVVSFKPDIPWQDQREADLQRGIKLWIAVTSRWSDECTLTVKLGEMRTEEEVFTMFAHVFSGRAPVTIRKRGAAILRLCDHLEQDALEPFPMKEITFYRFLCREESMGAPASRLKGMIQAVAFCRHVLDVVELQCILDSKRCSGIARESCPKERKQASPLTVNELNKLHEMVDNSSDLWDAVFAGAALLCCYCRGRWGDLMRSEKAFVDCDEEGKPAYTRDEDREAQDDELTDAQTPVLADGGACKRRTWWRLGQPLDAKEA